MKKWVILFSSFFLLKQISCQQGLPKFSFDNKSVDAWYQMAKGTNPKIALSASLVSYEDFKNFLQDYVKNQKNFLVESSWFGQKIDPENLNLSESSPGQINQPFSLKLKVPSGANCYFWGDLHGDVQALVTCLKMLRDNKIINDNFEIIQQDSYFFFLGDMVDRGQHQTDTLALIIHFALTNKGKVFLIRGNHEDLQMNHQFGNTNSQSGFIDQLKRLYNQQHPTKALKDEDPLYDSISLFYNLMPDVAFVGCNNNYMQCCHGGIEIRYSPKELLAQPEPLQFQLIKKSEKNTKFLKQILNDSNQIKYFNIDKNAEQFFSQQKFIDNNSPFSIFQFGFLWGDFNNNPLNNYSTFYLPERGIFMGKELTGHILKYYSTDEIKVRCIMRAHQHNPTLPGILAPVNSGIYSMWNNTIITNLSTGQFTDVIAFNKIAFFDDYSAWKLTNYSWNSTDTVQEKTELLEKWINNANFDTLPNLENLKIKSISELNAELLEKIKNEFEKKDPDYTNINNWFSEIKLDPLNKNDRNYLDAQYLLKKFNEFMNGYVHFVLKDYPLAEISLDFLVEEQLLKYKAREYYAKTVIDGIMYDKYDDALTYLNMTIHDPHAAAADIQISDSLSQELQYLIQATTESLEFD